MTKRLYYDDSHIREFTARVTSCERVKDGFAAVLDGSAFFPGGGGQEPDCGEIAGMAVLRIYEEGGEIFHVLPSSIPPGASVSCLIDWDRRFRRMQNHSGEHIVSGLVHNLYGFDNVGFHMGSTEVTVDFSGYLDRDELLEIETRANGAVFEDLPLTTSFPPPGELSGISYRSKLELTENVRLVTIEGIDVCACCAPHVVRTGEVGIIRIRDAIRHDGGVRISLLCGLDALDDYRKKSAANAAISALLSAKPDETDRAVKRLIAENEENKRNIAAFRSRLAEKCIAQLVKTDGNICIFEENFDESQLRAVVNAGAAHCSGICAAFSGSDEGGYRYVMGSRTVDLRAASGEINRAVSGRGGGRSEMIQGSALASRQAITEYFGTGKG